MEFLKEESPRLVILIEERAPPVLKDCYSIILTPLVHLRIVEMLEDILNLVFIYNI